MSRSRAYVWYLVVAQTPLACNDMRRDLGAATKQGLTTRGEHCQWREYNNRPCGCQYSNPTALRTSHQPYLRGPQDFLTVSCFASTRVWWSTSSYWMTPGPMQEYAPTLTPGMMMALTPVRV